MLRVYEVLALSCSLRIYVQIEKALWEKDFSSLKGQVDKLEVTMLVVWGLVISIFYFDDNRSNSDWYKGNQSTEYTHKPYWY